MQHYSDIKNGCGFYISLGIFSYCRMECCAKLNILLEVFMRFECFILVKLGRKHLISKRKPLENHFLFARLCIVLAVQIFPFFLLKRQRFRQDNNRRMNLN